MKRTRLSQQSQAMKVAQKVYKGLLLLLHPAWGHCARCQLPKDGAALDPHHPYKRGKGKFAWKLFVVVPLCRTCHDEIHANETQAREDGWLIDPTYKNPYEVTR